MAEHTASDVERIGYYRRMQAAVEELLILNGVVTREDVDAEAVAPAGGGEPRPTRRLVSPWWCWEACCSFQRPGTSCAAWTGRRSGLTPTPKWKHSTPHYQPPQSS